MEAGQGSPAMHLRADRMRSFRSASDISKGNLDPTQFWNRPPEEVAVDLLGFTFCVDGVGGSIVETEAYADDDPASHSFAGKTRRNATMFGPPGHAYVYRSYGLHWCVNFVCQRGSAVLLRALEPLHRVERMIERRGLSQPRLLCSGPGRLTMALSIDGSFDGLSLADHRFTLSRTTPTGPVVSGPRIGISKAADKAWRFGVANSPYLSKRFATPS